jgi:4-hydroxy-2-oxoheptanedioate aldolase
VDIKKRQFLASGVGAAMGMGMTANATQAQSLVRGQMTKQDMLTTMLDSPNWFGEGSKTGGSKSYAGSGKQTSMVDRNYKPRRINKAIELWEDNQTVFYAEYGPTGVADGYGYGKLMAKTWADAINYEMEHAAFDFSHLRSFMQGLVDGGPTPSGHRTPMVFVTLPMTGFSEAYMEANSWAILQALSAGAHGVHICHMRDPGAAEVMVAASRYPFDYPDVSPNGREGLRGVGSQGYSSHIWGISPNRYFEVADTWPHNPKGEISCGVKIEDKHALANAEAILAVRGIAFAEGGSGDMGMSIAGLNLMREMPQVERDRLQNADPRLTAAQVRVQEACKRNGVRWLGTSIPPLIGSPKASELSQQVRGGMHMYPAVFSEVEILAAREAQGRRMPI